MSQPPSTSAVTINLYNSSPGSDGGDRAPPPSPSPGSVTVNLHSEQRSPVAPPNAEMVNLYRSPTAPISPNSVTVNVYGGGTPSGVGAILPPTPPTPSTIQALTGGEKGSKKSSPSVVALASGEKAGAGGEKGSKKSSPSVVALAGGEKAGGSGKPAATDSGKKPKGSGNANHDSGKAAKDSNPKDDITSMDWAPNPPPPGLSGKRKSLGSPATPTTAKAVRLDNAVSPLPAEIPPALTTDYSNVDSRNEEI